MVAALALGACACGGVRAHPQTTPSGASRAESVGAVAAALPAASGAPAGDAAAIAVTEALVVEAWMTVEIDDVRAAAAAMRREVEARGGRVISESLGGAATSWQGSMTVRVPPAETDALVAWLDGAGEIRHKRVQATDVSKTLFERDLAIDNLRRTMARLQELLEREGVTMAEVLAIEKELGRVRGELERLEGEQRWLRDRVAYATVEIRLERRSGAVLRPEATLYPGLRGAMLVLLDPDGADRVRFGSGAVVHLGVPRVSLELDVFAGPEGEDAAVLATFGGAFYSDYFGRGERRFLNPYLGFRLGYGYLGDHGFAAAADAGVELFKSERVLVDANLRAVGIFGDDLAEPALVGGLSAVFAF